MNPGGERLKKVRVLGKLSPADGGKSRRKEGFRKKNVRMGLTVAGGLRLRKREKENASHDMGGEAP